MKMWWSSDNEPVGVVSTVDKILINNTDKYLYFSLYKPHGGADNQPVNYLLTESNIN